MSSGPAGPGLPGRSGRTCFFIQAGFGTAFTYLTSGVFLSGLAILMGAGDILVSYLSVIVNICGVLILAFPAFLERFTSRKKLTIALTILSRLATLFIVTIPVLFPAGIRLYVFAPPSSLPSHFRHRPRWCLTSGCLDLSKRKRADGTFP